METKTELMAWARAHRKPLPPRVIGCPCGCATRLPWIHDTACTRYWPVRQDPVCGRCLTVLDPDGTCFTCQSEPYHAG
jgi:hypothetical protein